MKKTTISTIKKKKAIVDNIISALDTRKCFLLLGHTNPDEDCIASLVSFALLAIKFEKETWICLDGKVHEHFEYLLNICKYNSIYVTDGSGSELPDIDTLVICDTPKRAMIHAGDAVVPLLDRSDIIKIEIDHHLEADSAYIGDPDYSLVDEASSACELVGLIALKLCNREDLIEKYHIAELFSRNLILSVLTGIIGDSKMGKFLKSSRERRFYAIFSNMFNQLLASITTSDANFSNKEEVFVELGRLSRDEGQCTQIMLNKKVLSHFIGYVVLDEQESNNLYRTFSKDTLVSVSRSISDTLAEESSFLSLVVYYDPPGGSELIQFRIRRCQGYNAFDLREILTLFSIENGGGHEGAIGFRVPRNQIPDIRCYVLTLVKKIEKIVATTIAGAQ